MSLDRDTTYYNFALNPAVTDDGNAGYLVNDLWTNSVTKETYICVDTTNGAAIWKPVTLGSVTINNNNEIVFNNNVVIEGGMVFGPAIDVNIVTDQNNLVISGLSAGVLVRFTPTGTRQITGIVPPSITSSSWMILYNIGGSNLTLVDNSASSSANNRFLMNSNILLNPNEGVSLIYDTSSLRWRSFARSI